MTNDKKAVQTEAELEAALVIATRQREEIKRALAALRVAGVRVERAVGQSLDNFSEVRSRLEELVKGMRSP